MLKVLALIITGSNGKVLRVLSVIIKDRVNN